MENNLCFSIAVCAFIVTCSHHLVYLYINIKPKSKKKKTKKIK